MNNTNTIWPPCDSYYVIPHPGTLQKVTVLTFEECMAKWFEGFNIPVLWTDGAPEPFEQSIERVRDYFEGDWGNLV